MLKKGYNPTKYFEDVERGKYCLDCKERHSSSLVEEIIIGTSYGTTFPTKVSNRKCNALIDTGATRSCISSAFLEKINSVQKIHPLCHLTVRSASGNSLGPEGLVTHTIQLGNQHFVFEFIVCKHLTRPLILGRDFLMKNKMAVRYSEMGKCVLDYKQKELIAQMDILENPCLKLKSSVTIPGRTLAVLNVDNTSKELQESHFYEVHPSSCLINEYPNLSVIPAVHKTSATKPSEIPFVVVNFSMEEEFIPKGEVLGYLIPQILDISEVTTEATFEPEDGEIVNPHELDLEDQKEGDKRFITSPADIEIHRKPDLKDVEVNEEQWGQFRALCKEFQDVFSESSEDIGKTPLLEMDIDTGDSPPICQKPYTLPLKHVAWVQKEIEILEKAGVIVKSVSPWASPVVIVPKRSAPGEPPKRRLCVDYRAVNSLLPPVKKAHSNAKGVLTLVPLPKIDEIYARLKGSKVYSSLDLRSGYHHIALSRKARPKSAFVLSFGKWEYKRCPFGLAQAPAYFQRLVNEVLSGLDFAFGYLDDILIFSPDVETHLQHLRIVFERLRKANLKMKESKCSFLKQHLQYLGHMLSGSGIVPVPEKLKSIQEMPPPTTPKEVKQFLGLVGYYRKFIPRFSDIARPMHALTKKGIEFDWTDQCQKSFELLKQCIMTEPILVYPDPRKPYVLFTDASKYAWACVLTQEKETEIDGKLTKLLHPITYVSGLFRGSQMNWACLTKEAYAIYMSVKKLAYYLEDADITLRSDHLPLKKFLKKNTLNSKVNNWAVEISPFRINFEYIKGIKNTLADTMSRLVEIDPSIQPEPEPQGFEFGYCVFEEPTKIEVESIDEMMETITNVQTPTNIDTSAQHLGLDESTIRKLQQQDSFCNNLKNQMEKGNLIEGQPYLYKKEILKRYVEDNGQVFEVTVIPRVMIGQVLKMAHDDLGHNGTNRTYLMLKRLVYWKGLKASVTKHVKHCHTCQKRNRQIVKYAKFHYDTATFPMEFISMDLVGEFHPPTVQGHRYALTVICMLTGYVFCEPLKSKKAEEVVDTYVKRIYSKFGGSRKILSDNGTEFKNQLFEQVAEELGVEHKLYTAPYSPASNGRIEGFHNFLKACISKHVTTKLNWDEVIPLACAAYNFMPNEHTRESPFYMMFARDPVLPLNTLLARKIRYLGDDRNMISLEALKNMYEIAATNLKKAKEQRGMPVDIPPRTLKQGDTVMIKNHTAGPFDPKYLGDYRIVAFRGNQVEIRPAEGGTTKKEHIKNVKYVDPAQRYVDQLPAYSQFGRKATWRLDPDKIPDLKWEVTRENHTTNIGQPEEVNYDYISTYHDISISLDKSTKVTYCHTTPLVSTYVKCAKYWQTCHLPYFPTEGQPTKMVIPIKEIQ